MPISKTHFSFSRIVLFVIVCVLAIILMLYPKKAEPRTGVGTPFIGRDYRDAQVQSQRRDMRSNAQSRLERAQREQYNYGPSTKYSTSRYYQREANQREIERAELDLKDEKRREYWAKRRAEQDQRVARADKKSRKSFPVIVSPYPGMGPSEVDIDDDEDEE